MPFSFATARAGTRAKKPRRHAIALVAAIFVFVATPAHASTTLANFENNNLNGWIVTGNGWTTGGVTGTIPNLSPAEGTYFARCGAPNGTNDIAESNTGIITSRPFKATHNLFTWLAAGWSGQSYDASSYFQILDNQFNVVAQIATPQSDSWVTLTVDLAASGIPRGATFYFRAVDGKSANNYSWLAFDNLKLSESPPPANFESGDFSGWTLTGNAWTVGGTTGTSPNLSPIEGSYFARSGAPNGAGVLAESNAGTATSPAFHATHDTITWRSAGWSGPTYNGLSSFQVLDAGFNVVTQIQTPQTDSWTIQSVNLITSGIIRGAVFYFRAVDGSTSSNNSWMAFDELKLTGTELAGPSGADLIKSLVIDPSSPAILYAGTNNKGVFKSTNGGGSWTQTSLLGDVWAMAIDPSSPTTVYAALNSGGIVKSTDGGTNWSGINNGIPPGSVYSLAISPTTPSTIYAGTSSGGVLKSTNGGSSWSATGLSGYITALAIDPSAPDTLYAADPNIAVFKSTNGGTSWSSSLAGGGIYRLAIDPLDSSIVYAGGTGSGVLKSVNSGGNWSSAITGLPMAFYVEGIAVDPSAPAIVYVVNSNIGVYRSNNRGGAWVPANIGLTNVLALAIDPLSSAVYAGTISGKGVFKSIDRGNSWDTTGPTSGNGLAPATLITEVTGGGQVGVIGQQLRYPLTVVVTNANGVPVAGASVTFSAVAGGGLLSGTQSVTDAQGVAFTRLTLGSLGINTVTATAGLSGSPLTFTAQGIQGGPQGGQVYSLALDPVTSGVIYAGSCCAGVFKSTNGGVSWAPINAGITNLTGNVSALAIDPLTPETAYVGHGGGLFKTTNAGQSWTGASVGLTNTAVNVLKIDASSTATLYAGTNGGGIFKSVNGGASWSAGNSGLTNLVVRAIAIDPTSSTTLYAGTNGGVFQSVNGGTTWSAINNGITNLSISSVAVDPTSAVTLYAGSSAGLFKSTNGGGSWGAQNTGLTNAVVLSLAIDPSSPGILYAGTNSGVFKTVDGAANWSGINTGIPAAPVNALAIDSLASSTVYAGTQSGVFKTTNSGGSWNGVSTGITSFFAFTLLIDPSAPATVYAGTNGGGVFRSTNGGTSWAAANTGLTNLFILALALHPSVPNTLYAGTSSAGVFKTTNGGASWSAANTGLTSSLVLALAIDPSTPATVYAGTFAGGGGGGVFKSTNAGGSWTAANTGLTSSSVSALAIDPRTTSTLYAGTNTGVFKSSNAGTSWTGTSLTTSTNALSIDPSNSSILYAAGVAGVSKSTNGGTSWSAINTGFAVLQAFALGIDPSAPGRIFAAMEDGLYRSTDGGNSWSPAILSNGANFGFTSFAIDASSPGAIYTGTRGGGIFKSIDGGISWLPAGANAGSGIPPATKLSKVSGDNQTENEGRPARYPLVVVVTNANGVPISGVAVNYAITAGTGTLGTSQLITDTHGVAFATLSAVGIGTNTVTATTPGLVGSGLSFTVTGRKIRGQLVSQ